MITRARENKQHVDMIFENAVINNSSYLELALREWKLKHVACEVRAVTGHLE